MKYNVGDEVLVDGQKGEIYRKRVSRCKCKGESHYLINMEDGSQIRVAHKDEHIITPLEINTITNIKQHKF